MRPHHALVACTQLPILSKNRLFFAIVLVPCTQLPILSTGERPQRNSSRHKETRHRYGNQYVFVPVHIHKSAHRETATIVSRIFRTRA